MRAIRTFAAFVLTSFFAFGMFSEAYGQDEQPAPKSSAPDKQNNQSESANQVQAGNSLKTLVSQREERYRIGFQDSLEVTVSRHPELSLNVNVSPDGTIRLPRISEPIVAVCKTERELANEIAERYKKDLLRDPFVNVRATEQRSQIFAVIGAVEKPGSFYLNRRIRLLELLSFAGGPDTEKAGSRLIVARTGSTSFCREGNDASIASEENPELVLYQFKIRDVLEGKENLWMQPGDIVSVLEADVFYIYGNVNEQGSYKMTRPLTLRQAIAEAKGFKPASRKDKIRVLRQKAGSTDWEETLYNLKEIDEGKVKDPLLLPNDIVAVSEDSAKKILNGITKSLTGGIGNLPLLIP